MNIGCDDGLIKPLRIKKSITSKLNNRNEGVVMATLLRSVKGIHQTVPYMKNWTSYRETVAPVMTEVGKIERRSISMAVLMSYPWSKAKLGAQRIRCPLV
jgi:hypothetical protein